MEETLSWFTIGDIPVEAGFLHDNLSYSMLLVISIVSSLVQIYSLTYMYGDVFKLRFFICLFLFTGSMYVLVTSANLIQFFIGWEGVGLCSYFLINFWHSRIQANKAAIKALIVNRIGDFALLIAICLIIQFLGTAQFGELNVSHVMAVMRFEQNLFTITGTSIIQTVSLLLLVAIMAKSAQIVFHTWLPDAMEGPTPVSALLHSATMVTAGVYLLMRLFIFFVVSNMGDVIMLIGLITSIVSGLIAVCIYDYKRVIAYSTCSQLGFMVFSCGAGQFDVALLHLIFHAFFKSALFLGAGSVIHTLNDEQDIRRMGGLFRFLPFTYVTTVINTLALMAFPFLSGFYSKDLILELLLKQIQIDGRIIYHLALASAILTSIYSFRLVYTVFHGPCNVIKVCFKNLHEPETPALVSITGLTILTIFCGPYFFFYLMEEHYDIYSYINIPEIFYQMTYDLPFTLRRWEKNYPVTVLIYSFVVASFVRVIREGRTYYWLSLPEQIRTIRIFFTKRFFFDSIYNYYISYNVHIAAYRFFYRYLDKGLFEYFGPLGANNISAAMFSVLKKTQNGFLITYNLLSVVGFLFFLVIMLCL